MKTKVKRILKKIWKYIGFLYFPIYTIFWALHKVARLFLAITYYGLLDFKRANDIIKYLFTGNGRS